MIFWTFEVAQAYVGHKTLASGWERFISFGALVGFHFREFFFAGVAGYLLMFFFKIPKSVKWFSVVFVLFSFVSIVPGLHFYPHYFYLIFPAWTFGIVLMYEELRLLFKKILPEKIFPVVAGMGFISIFIFNPVYRNIYLAKIGPLDYCENIFKGNPFAEAWVLSEIAKEKARPGDKVYVFGSEPEIYFYLQLEAVTEHITQSYWGVSRETEFRNVIMKQIERKRPRFIFYVKNSYSVNITEKDVYFVQWLMDYLLDNYYSLAVVDRTVKNKPNVVTGPKALDYIPNGENFMILFERNP